MKKISISIAALLTILFSSLANDFSGVFKDEKPVTFYFGPDKSYYDGTISNLIYTFNPDGTGWVMTGIFPNDYVSGEAEPEMSYNMGWETFNDTIKISLSIEDREVARQFFRVTKNGDSLIQLREYPLMIPISLWRISQIELEQGSFSKGKSVR